MPKAVFTSASSGLNAAVIAAPGAGKFLKLTGLSFSSAGTVTATFQDDAGTPVVIHKIHAVAGTAVECPPNTNREWNCMVNKALDISLSGAVSVTGSIYYEIVNTTP